MNYEQAEIFHIIIKYSLLKSSIYVHFKCICDTSLSPINQLIPLVNVDFSSNVKFSHKST